MTVWKLNLKFMDSQADTVALSGSATHSKLVDEWKSNLNVLPLTNKVRVDLVPGHSAILGNDKADSLSRKGSERHLWYRSPSVSVLSYASV